MTERIGGQLTDEQEMALLVLTGPERASVLVGPAGTGKGVVIDAAARTEQLAGRETLGIAVAGSTAERLGNDSPALAGSTLTLDALIARAKTGTVHVGPDTTVILDEAGMVDHKRLDDLTDLIDRSGAKLIAVGDGKQLPSIGPGGMFDRLTQHAPTVELDTIHRTTDPREQRAWQALRAGEPERAMAHYQAKGNLHLSDTRDKAAEKAVQAWARLTETYDMRQVALIADASNVEIDRLNARAQHLRDERGELGPRETYPKDTHYGIREGDHVAFIAQHRPTGQPRVENGSRGEVTNVGRDGTVTLSLDGSNREIVLAGKEIDSLRLAYAQHVYRQQGATVGRSIVLTGGWQTSKESAYVQATRAPPRHRLARRPRPTRRRRTRPRQNHTPRRMHGPEPRAHTIHRPPRDTRPRLGPHSRPATACGADPTAQAIRPSPGTKRGRARHWTWPLIPKLDSSPPRMGHRSGGPIRRIVPWTFKTSRRSICFPA